MKKGRVEYHKNKSELIDSGYSILENLYSEKEVSRILECIEKHDGASILLKDLFAIRQLVNQIQDLAQIIFNQKLKSLMTGLYQTDYFLTKAIYFDKPKNSNWFVAYHQDLSISVEKKVELEDYKNWTFKKGQYGVQPPIKILQDTITLRIHLDDTDESNGALRVIPKSHSNGIIRVDSKQWDTQSEQICQVKRGGAMLMKPLTLHASSRSINSKQRRVIHLEFNTNQLIAPLKWLEYQELKTY